MTLNKKYKPTQSLKISQNKGEKSDAFFPIFLPIYRKFSSQELIAYHYALIFSRNMQQFAQKSYAPLVLAWLPSWEYSLALSTKKQMPLFAQLQRLAQVEQKNIKKNLTFLQYFFPDFVLKNQNLSERHQSALKDVLMLLSEKGTIKKDLRTIYRDISTGTIVHPDDIEWRAQKVYKLEVKCFVETKKEVLTLVVDDLLTFFADQGVVVHADDRRYKKHIGKNIILPVINKSIPIYAEEWIDTLTDNGIVRLNPLLSQSMLEEIKKYNLDPLYNAIDSEGKILPELQDFAGKSFENFEENIVEILDMIGNLSSKQQIEKLIPYSKITGQRLIKRVENLYAIECWSYFESFKNWLNETYPQFMSLLPNREPWFLLQSKGVFLQKILEYNQVLSTLQLDDFLDKNASIFELLLFVMAGFWYLSEQMNLEELIDMVYLIPQKIWTLLADISDRFSMQEILEYQQKLLNAQPEELFDYLEKELEKISRVEKKDEKSAFSLFFSNYFKQKDLNFLDLDTGFLRVAHLWQLYVENKESLVFFSPYDGIQNQLLLLLFLLFLSGEKKALIWLRELKELKYLSQIPDKIQQYVQEYGRDTLYLTMVHQEKIEEKTLQNAYSYLHHFWNLFKFLYENWAFDSSLNNTSVEAIDLRAYTQREELFEQYQNYQKTWLGLKKLLESVQSFTQGEFSWYLEFLKNEKKQRFQVAAKIFDQILKIFHPYMPFLTEEIAYLQKKQIWSMVTFSKMQGQKDYKLHLLFEVVKGVSHYKQQAQIKKHQSIMVYVQANAERIALLEEYAPLLRSLLKIQEMNTISYTESFPEGLEIIEILDMKIAFQLLQTKKDEGSLVNLEKQLVDLQQHLEYIRQTLMMLSTSPIPQTQKIADKEQEMQDLKNEIDILEIKIRKLKAQKK